MAYNGSRGPGSRARGGGSGAPARAAAPAPDDGPGSRRLAGLPAADLVGHLIRRNRRASDFVDVALVLAARERRLADAEARVRAAEEAAARLRDEIAARERGAAEAEAQIRRLVAATEARLQAEISAWQRRAGEAEARLEAYAGGRDDHREVGREDEQHGLEGAGIRAPSSLKRITGPALAPPVLQAEQHGEGTEVGIVGIADLTGHEHDGEAQAEEQGRREEAPLQRSSSGKRRESAEASPEGKRMKKLKLRAGGGTCSNAVSESEADTRDEAEAEDAWDDQYALAIVPEACDLPEASPAIGDVPGTLTEPKHGGTDMSVEGNHESENVVALAVVAPGHDELLPPDGGVEARGVQETGGLKPEVARTAASAYAQRRGDIGDEPENGVLDMQGSLAPAATHHSGSATRDVVPEPGASEKSTVTAIAVDGPPRKKGTFYKMVFKALKEKERQAAVAKPATTASQPSLRCWLYAPLPKESVAMEEGPDGDDKDTQQQ